MYHGLVASCAEDGGPDRRGDFSGSQLPGEKGAEVDAPGGGPLSGACVRLDDRADGCGVPGAGLLQGLESRSVPYIARIRKNEVLNRDGEPYLTQPAGRSPDAPPRLWFHEADLSGGELGSGARVVLVVRERPGELYPIISGC